MKKESFLSNLKITLAAVATTITIMCTVNMIYATNEHVKDLFQLVFEDLKLIKQDVSDIKQFLMEHPKRGY